MNERGAKTFCGNCVVDVFVIKEPGGSVIFHANKVYQFHSGIREGLPSCHCSLFTLFKIVNASLVEIVGVGTICRLLS